MNIIDFIPYGKENAINRKRLCTLSGMPDRVMRKQIEKERGEHAILNAQDGGGYFRPLPEEKPLVERWLRQERSRGRSVEQSTRGAEKFLVGDCGTNVITVHGYVRRRHKAAEPIKQVDGQVRW